MSIPPPPWYFQPEMYGKSFKKEPKAHRGKGHASGHLGSGPGLNPGLTHSVMISAGLGLVAMCLLGPFAPLERGLKTVSPPRRVSGRGQ